MEDDDCYDGPDDSEYETDDSNGKAFFSSSFDSLLVSLELKVLIM